LAGQLGVFTTADLLLIAGSLQLVGEQLGVFKQLTHGHIQLVGKQLDISTIAD
jgi:hypothetical protein